MATYAPDQLGIKAPAGGFQQGGWYAGRQYWDGTLSDPGVIHSSSNQQGAGQAVSAEVNAQSAAAQGVSTQNFTDYINQQRQNQPASARPVTNTPTPSNSSTSTISQTGTGGIVSPTPTINLPELYKTMYESSGISGLEEQLAKMERAKTEVIGKNNDNPYLSEGTRLGRVAKIEELHADRTKNLRNEIATKRADIEMQMNLQTKQFDINQQTAQLALQQFNSLLEMGALDNASGEDLANITRTTGLSSSLIQSAIQAKQIAGLQSSTETFDDGVNEGFIIYTIDKQGNIVNQVKQITGISSKKATSGYTGDSSVDNWLKKFLAAQESAEAIDEIPDDEWNRKVSQSNQTFRNLA